MRVAVTGSGGLIGTEVVAALSAAGSEVVRLVRRPGKGREGGPLGPGEGDPRPGGAFGTGRRGPPERVVAAFSLDPRLTPEAGAVCLAATRRGLVFRFSLDPYREPTTRSGRRFGRPVEDDEIVFVGPCARKDIVAMASEQGRAILFDSGEVPLLAGPGKGVIGLRLAAGDRVVGVALFSSDERRPVLVLENSRGTQHTVTRRYEVVGRGGKGFHLIKRDRLVRAIPSPVALVDFTGREG